MSTAGRTDVNESDAVEAAATAIREASLVRLVASTDGDAVAAASQLAVACAERSVPYHVGFAGSRAQVDTQVTAADAATTTITLGTSNPVGRALVGQPGGGATHSIALVAFEAARELGSASDPAMALAGALSAGVSPDDAQAEPALGALREHGFERRPGVAIPVADPVDGMAHSTLLHAAFSGDIEATRELLRPFDIGAIEDGDGGRDADSDCNDGAPFPDDDHKEDTARRLASVVALTATEDTADGERAAGALERALHPHVVEGPFRTLGGYADVLTAMAARDPGLVVAQALGADVRQSALDAWRDHGTAVHAGIREADTERYSGLLVANIAGAPVVTVARLLRDYQSPEPAVLVVDEEDGSVAIAGEDERTGAALTAVLENGGIDRGRIGYALGGPKAETDSDSDSDSETATDMEMPMEMDELLSSVREALPT